MIEEFLDKVRMFVNLDIFGIPGMSCISPPSYYTKLWGSLAFPTLLIGAIMLMFQRDMRNLHLDHIPDESMDSIVSEHMTHQHHLERKAKHADNENYEMKNGMKSHRKVSGPCEHKKELDTHKDGAFDEHDPEVQAELQRRLLLHQTRSNYLQTAIGKILFIVFLVYPSLTNRIFGLFNCYEVTDDIAYLNEDFNLSCTDDAYKFQAKLGALLVFLIPLGVPFVAGVMILKHRREIIEHHGPHHLESLYSDFKPECCPWECYLMMQKVTLIGLLTFVDRGSVLQTVVGFLVANYMLLMMVREQPYLEHRTNVLSISGQTLIVIAYIASMLMRINLDGEMFTVDAISGIILAANVPMTVYLLYDTWVTMREELHAARIDLLRAELGDVGSTYRCMLKEGVPISRHLKKKKIVGRVKHHELITVIGQAITFNEGGCVAKLETPRGWVSYNHHGLVGHRYFVLVSTATAHGEEMGSINCNIKYNKRDNTCHVNILRCEIDAALQIESEKPKEEQTERAGLYVVVRVNGHGERTTVKQITKPEWNDGTGESLTFDMATMETKYMETIMIKLYGVQMGRNWLTADSEDLIGIHSLAMDDYLDLDEWELDAVGVDKLVVREELGSLPEHLDPNKIDELAAEDAAKGAHKPDKKSKKSSKKQKKGAASTHSNPMFNEEGEEEPQLTVAQAAMAKKMAGKAKQNVKDKSRAYRCVKQTLLREKADLGSKKCGQLQPGNIVEVVEEKLIAKDADGAVIEGGILRLHIKGLGWCSRTNVEGETIMEKVKAVSKQEAKERAAQKKKDEKQAQKDAKKGAKKGKKKGKIEKAAKGGKGGKGTTNPLFSEHSNPMIGGSSSEEDGPED